MGHCTPISEQKVRGLVGKGRGPGYKTFDIGQGG